MAAGSQHSVTKITAMIAPPVASVLNEAGPFEGLEELQEVD